MSEHDPGEPDFGHDDDAQDDPGEPSFEEGEGSGADLEPEQVEGETPA